MLQVLAHVLGVHRPARGQPREAEDGAGIGGLAAVSLPVLGGVRAHPLAGGVLVQVGRGEGEGHGIGVLGAAQVAPLQAEGQIAQRGHERERAGGHLEGLVGGAPGAGGAQRERSARTQGGGQFLVAVGGGVLDTLGLLLLSVVGQLRQHLFGIEQIFRQICLHICLADDIVSGRVVPGVGRLIAVLRPLVGRLGVIALVGHLAGVAVIQIVQDLVAAVARGHGHGIVADDHALGLFQSVGVPAGQHQQHRQDPGQGLAHGAELAGRVAADHPLLQGAHVHRSRHHTGLAEGGLFVQTLSFDSFVAHVFARSLSCLFRGFFVSDQLFRCRFPF